ncbi:MAG: hypothetical protein ACYTBS_22265, partial [Planctomycetota bacterium]
NSTARQSGGGRVLVIPTAEEIEPQDFVSIMEDATVMCRIFDKKLDQHDLTGWNSLFSISRRRNRTSLSSPLLRDDRSTRAIYIQGYGMLFLAKVGIRLSPPPSTARQEEVAEREDIDPLWAQTRQEIYAPEQANERRKNDPRAQYDAEEIETLKETIVKALKHAANIRGIEPDESVILTLAGTGVSSHIVSVRAIPETDKFVVVDAQNVTRVYEGAMPNEIVISAPTVLTIRAEKSDIDGFAKGDFGLGEFARRVQMLSYPVLGGAVASEDAADTMRDALLGLRHRSAQ